MLNVFGIWGMQQKQTHTHMKIHKHQAGPHGGGYAGRHGGHRGGRHRKNTMS